MDGIVGAIRAVLDVNGTTLGFFTSLILVTHDRKGARPDAAGCCHARRAITKPYLVDIGRCLCKAATTVAAVAGGYVVRCSGGSVRTTCDRRTVLGDGQGECRGS